MKLTVVVNTFDRPVALRRLLQSLSECNRPDGTNLVISVDGGGSQRGSTLSLVEDFGWSHGLKMVIERDDLGLVDHFRACGDLVDDHGPVLLLEDDLVVGPNAIEFASAALEHTTDDHRIAGVSLSTPWFDGFRHLPFEPLVDGSAAVLAKVPWFHGMAWTPEQWRSHRVGAGVDRSVPLPVAFAELDDAEWFPDAVRSLVADDRWYLLARDSHAVNFGDAGVHFDQPTSMFQRPLVRGRFTPPVLPCLDDEWLVPYDEYQEPDPRWLSRHVDELEGLDVTMDLRAVRVLDDVSTEWIVTSRPSLLPVARWGTSMRPLEQNLLSGVPGDGLTLSRVEDVVAGPKGERAAVHTLERHAYRGQPPGIRSTIRGSLESRLRSIRGRA